MAKFLAQLLHLEDTHKWMVAKDSVYEGGEGGDVVGEVRVVGEAKLVDEARAEGEVTNPEVHHQVNLLLEANQAVLHHEGEEDEEGEGTPTVATSLRTSRVSPPPR